MRVRRAGSCLLLMAIAGQALAEPPATVRVGMDAAGGVQQALPDGWQPLTFEKIARHTGYRLEQDGGDLVVRADSQQSASGLVRPLSISPVDYPLLEWRWKVDNTLVRGDVTRKSGDDYPARIYITFALDPDRASYLDRLAYRAGRLLFGPDVPYRAISYIWGNRGAVGTHVPNAYTDRVVMYVVQSGDEHLRQWKSERRNVFEDYRQAFGEEPYLITGVAIMTDTDNTQEDATAWYGDIVFRRTGAE